MFLCLREYLRPLDLTWSASTGSKFRRPIPRNIYSLFNVIELSLFGLHVDAKQLAATVTRGGDAQVFAQNSYTSLTFSLLFPPYSR